MRIIAPLLVLLSPLASWANDTTFVGQFPAKIVPNQVQMVNLPEKSLISDLAPEGACEKGQIIARLDADEMAEGKVDLELKILRDKITKTDAIRDLEKKKRELEFYMSLSKKEREFETTIYKSEDLPPERALEDLNMRLELAIKELDRAEYTLRKDFADKEKKSILVMPFRGRLQYHITLPDDMSAPFECTPVQQFATVCDDSAFYISIGISQTDLTQLPAERFSVSIPLPAGKELTGKYDHRRVERNATSDLLVYYFRVPQEDHEVAFSMIGTQGKARLYYHGTGDVKRLSKAQLSSDPRASSVEDWQELIQIIYPDYNILLEADKDILIIPKGQEP